MIKKFNFSQVYDLQNSSRTSFYQRILFSNSDLNVWSSSETTLPKDKTKEEFDKKKKQWKKILINARDKRDMPDIDDKILTSWNGLMINAFVDAYRVFKDDKFLNAASSCAEFIIKNMTKSDGGLYHTHKDDKSTVNGYLEDYGSIIQAFLNLYENTLDEKWLNISNDLFWKFKDKIESI